MESEAAPADPPWEVAMLLRGLEMAYERCADAHRDDFIPDPVCAPVSAWEFVGWACALDDWLSETTEGYKSKRNRDPDGRLLLGLRFARDRHVHQAVLVAVSAFALMLGPGGPVLYPPAFTWRNLADVKEPNDFRATSKAYAVRRKAYVADLQGRPALPTLARARAFLSTELRAHGIT